MPWTKSGNLGLREPMQWIATATYHALGTGQMDMPIWIDADRTILKLRYRIKTLGSGTGTPLVELRRTDPAVTGNALAGTSLTPAVAPSWQTTGLPNLNADDLLWAVITGIHATTPSIGLKVEMLTVRR